MLLLWLKIHWWILYYCNVKWIKLSYYCLLYFIFWMSSVNPLLWPVLLASLRQQVFSELVATNSSRLFQESDELSLPRQCVLCIFLRESVASSPVAELYPCNSMGTSLGKVLGILLFLHFFKKTVYKFPHFVFNVVYVYGCCFIITNLVSVLGIYLLITCVAVNHHRLLNNNKSNLICCSSSHVVNVNLVFYWSKLFSRL